MSRYEILDTLPTFNRFWRRARSLPVESQVDAWKRDYLRRWPELFRMQVADYRRQGVDWRRVARVRIFPRLDERIARMSLVRSRLRRAIPIAVARFRDRLGLDFPVRFVIHVGVGCGAGWATTFGGRPAVLFGLENAAELGWTDSNSAVALVEHELAHLLHDRWRREARLRRVGDYRGAWWQLYEEGFATYCELKLGPIGNHHSTETSRDWLEWCRKNRSRLATRYLAAVSSRRPTRQFFGSWNNIAGYINTGYYLGAEVIRDWESRASLREVASWTSDQVRRRARSSLERMVADAAALPMRIRR